MPLPDTVPLIAAIPIVSENVPIANVAPARTVTVAPSASRFDAPSARVPASMFTVVAASVPLSVETPLDCVSVPAPRLPFTVAAFNVYVAAVSVPVPASVPFSARLATVSLFAPRSSVAPVATLTAPPSASTFDAPSASVPADTVVPPT